MEDYQAQVLLLSGLNISTVSTERLQVLSKQADSVVCFVASSLQYYLKCHYSVLILPISSVANTERDTALQQACARLHTINIKCQCWLDVLPVYLLAVHAESVQYCFFCQCSMYCTIANKANITSIVQNFMSGCTWHNFCHWWKNALIHDTFLV